MDKEKEIEQLALDIVCATSPLGVKDLTKQFDYKPVAEYLINAGYRKADKVRKKTVKEIIADLKNAALTATLTFNPAVAEALKTIYLRLEREYDEQDGEDDE